MGQGIRRVANLKGPVSQKVDLESCQGGESR